VCVAVLTVYVAGGTCKRDRTRVKMNIMMCSVAAEGAMQHR
jgi:hypothetical protein